jgi:hypothetical protein
MGKAKPKSKKKKSPDSWGKIPWKKGEEAKGEITQMDNDEFFRLSSLLEDRHSIFYKFWEVGKPYFTRSIPNACVQWDAKSGKLVAFLFNPDFWAWLDDYSRLFVIAHEMLHIILRHGLRTKDCKRPYLSNIGLDVVVNHLLVKKFGFNRKKVKGADDLCWTNTVFDDNPHYSGSKPIEKDKAFEYYYVEMKKHFPVPKRDLKPGAIVWNRSTKSWGKVTKVDTRKGTVKIKPLDKKDVLKELKKGEK